MAHRAIVRNVDTACEDPRGLRLLPRRLPAGRQAVDDEDLPAGRLRCRGAVVVGCRAERILVAGWACGRRARRPSLHADGASTELTVHAPTVVVAGGAVESPALLLRSGIGGPAAGKHLRLHPASIVAGVYDEPIEPGTARSSRGLAISSRVRGRLGFLIESVGATPVLHAGALPWTDGEQPQGSSPACCATTRRFISVARDHGEGEVVIDDYGQAVVRWSLDDEVDRALMVRAHVELARLHHAAGAPEIRTLHAVELSWRADW